MPLNKKVIKNVNSHNQKFLLNEFGFANAKQAKKELDVKRVSEAMNLLKQQHNIHVQVDTAIRIHKLYKLQKQSKFEQKHKKLFNKFNLSVKCIMSEVATHLLNYNDKKRRGVSSRAYRSVIPSSNGTGFVCGNTINIDFAGNNPNSYYD